MAYSTKEHVAAEFKGMVASGGFSASSTPTGSDVERFIEEADAEIDGRVGTRYVTPITGEKSLVIIRSISIGLVAGRVKEILRVKSGDAKVDQETRAGDMISHARSKLKWIAEGTLLLSDATLKKAGDGVSPTKTACDTKPIFDKDKEQW
jgi:hypothetical protein